MCGRREYIVQSALSQQVQRFESELGVLLLKRSDHVSLTAAGAAFLAEARQILAHPARAAAIASRAAARLGTAASIIDASRDSTPEIARGQARYPGLVIHQVKASVPVSAARRRPLGRRHRPGRAGPPQVASHLFRHDPLGSWFRPATGSPHWTPSRSPSGPTSRCCSPRRSGPRNSTSSPSKCAGPPASPPPCARAPWKASARPPTWSPRDTACTACRPPASPRSRNDLAAAHRTSLLLPVVSAVARHRHLRPRAGHRQLRTNHVPATRLARRPKADGALTGPDTVRPVVTPLRRAVTTVRSESKCLLPMVSKAQAALRSTLPLR